MGELGNVFPNLVTFKHFASGAKILFAKGKVGATSEFGLQSVLTRHPTLRDVHRYVMEQCLPQGCNICSVKFLKHDGTPGMERNPIKVGEDEFGAIYELQDILSSRAIGHGILACNASNWQGLHGYGVG